jgi:hypothetical protein
MTVCIQYQKEKIDLGTGKMEIEDTCFFSKRTITSMEYKPNLVSLYVPVVRWRIKVWYSHKFVGFDFNKFMKEEPPKFVGRGVPKSDIAFEKLVKEMGKETNPGHWLYGPSAISYFNPVASHINRSSTPDERSWESIQREKISLMRKNYEQKIFDMEHEAIMKQAEIKKEAYRSCYRADLLKKVRKQRDEQRAEIANRHSREIRSRFEKNFPGAVL